MADVDVITTLLDLWIRRHRLASCRQDGLHRWVSCGVIADDLATTGHAMKKQVAAPPPRGDDRRTHPARRPGRGTGKIAVVTDDWMALPVDEGNPLTRECRTVIHPPRLRTRRVLTPIGQPSRADRATGSTRNSSDLADFRLCAVRRCVACVSHSAGAQRRFFDISAPSLRSVARPEQANTSCCSQLDASSLTAGFFQPINCLGRSLSLQQTACVSLKRPCRTSTIGSRHVVIDSSLSRSGRTLPAGYWFMSTICFDLRRNNGLSMKPS
jgi:hypothetical protein